MIAFSQSSRVSYAGDFRYEENDAPTGCGGVIALGGFGYLYFRKPVIAPPGVDKVEATQARIERGKYLFNLADCDGCHSQRDFSRLRRTGNQRPRPGI